METRREPDPPCEVGGSNRLPVIQGIQVFRGIGKEDKASPKLGGPGKQFCGQIILNGHHDGDALMLRKLDLDQGPEHAVLKDGLDGLLSRHFGVPLLPAQRCKRVVE